MKKLFLLLVASFTVNAQRYEPRPYYAAQVFTVSWNRWEHAELPADGNSVFVVDDVERYDSAEVFEHWWVDYGRAHELFFGKRRYDTLDIWYDMSLSIPLKRRIEVVDGVFIYDQSPAHNVFANMGIRNEVSAFNSVNLFGEKYWRATRHAVGLRMNGLPTLRYRVRVGLLWVSTVADRSVNCENVSGVPVDWSRVTIGGVRCDPDGVVTLDIPGGGAVTDVTPAVSGEGYIRWGDFFVGQPVLLPAPRISVPSRPLQP